MCEGDALPMMIMLQALDVFASSPGVCEQAIASLGSLSLRLGHNAATITARGGMRLICAAMRRHNDHVGVQRAACLAVRNMVVRSKERVALAFEEGIEPLLVAAYSTHMVARDVAYACLRDLGVSYAETTVGLAAAERATRALAAGDIATK